MPVTFFALLVVSVIMAGGLTVWALNAWGGFAVLSVLLCLALGARWAFAHVPNDDGKA